MTLTEIIKKAKKVVEYTNERLKKWYENAKIDYNIEGYAIATFNHVDNTIEIKYTEDGITKTYVEKYWIDEQIDYTFNVWSEN